MARSNNPLLKNTSGRIGKSIVIKTYAYGTVISAYPDMSKVKPSAKQLHEKHRFRDAVHYAKSILADEAKKAELQKALPPGKSVFNAVISEFMKKGVPVSQQSNP